MAQELDEPFEKLDTLLDRMDAEAGMGNRKLESRVEGLRKSRLLLDRINEALTVLKKKPGNGPRLYELIYLTYIVPEKLSHTDLLFGLIDSTYILPAARGSHLHSFHPAVVGAGGGAGKTCGAGGGFGDVKKCEMVGIWENAG